MFLVGYALLAYGGSLAADWLAVVTYGFGSTCAYVCAIAPNLRLFPSETRGLVVGMFVATYAVSPILFIKIKNVVFAELGRSYESLGIFFVLFGAMGFGASLVMAAALWGGDEATKLMNSAAKSSAPKKDADVEGEVSALLDNVASTDSDEDAGAGSGMNPYVSATGKELLWSNKKAAGPFWILAISFGLAVCSGLAVINQLGVISRVLEASEDRAVAFFSVGSATARLVLGAVCDFIYARGFHRGYALIFESAFLFVVLMLLSSPLATAGSLPYLAAAAGFGYGGNWAVGTSIVNLSFGAAGFGLNLGFITAAPSLFIVFVNRIFGALVPAQGCASADGKCLALPFFWLAFVSATSAALGMLFIFATSNVRSDLYKKPKVKH